MQHSPYYNPEAIRQAVETNQHREAIGGLWEQLGQLQLDFLKSQGMQPEHHLLDIGCGALRLGVRAVDYLDSGHYFGLDLSRELINAGYTKEFTQTQRERLPQSNLTANDQFDFSFLPQPVDFAIAQSVFTHLPLNHIRRCLSRLAPHLAPGGAFFATAWIVPESHPADQPYPQPGAINGTPIITTDLADPYHYHLTDFTHIIENLPYQMELHGEWNHPRSQPMLVFRKL